MDQVIISTDGDPKVTFVCNSDETRDLTDEEIGEIAVAVSAESQGLEIVEGLPDKEIVADHLDTTHPEFEYVQQDVDEVTVDREQASCNSSQSKVVTVNGDTIFDEFDEFSTKEKSYLHRKYIEKATGPQIFSASNSLLEKAPSAGFATAVVSYGILESFLLALSLFIMSVSSFVYILQKRTEITGESFPELHSMVEDIGESAPIEEDVTMYVVGIPVKSPFTLPIGSPDIYVPKRVFSSITLEEYRAVIEHELGHHENSLVGPLVILASFVSANFIAPILVIFTPLTPSVTLFAILFGLLFVVEFGISLLLKSEEQTADSFVSNPVALSRLLVRSSQRIIHTNSRLGEAIHQFSDPHPPMNKRIESAFDSDATIQHNVESVTKSAVLGIILITIGSLASGYGFLTFIDSSGVGPQPLFYGVVLITVGTYLGIHSRLEHIWMRAIAIVALVAMFLVNVGIGSAFGAESLVESVAVGRLGREIVFTIGISLLATLFFLRTLFKDYTVNLSELNKPPQDWKETIEDWE